MKLIFNIERANTVDTIQAAAFNAAKFATKLINKCFSDG